MAWSGTKQLPSNKKYYRFNEHSNGDKDILESGDEWAIERGLCDEDEEDYLDDTFDHFFKRSEHWFVQRNVRNQYLFVDPQDRQIKGYPIETVKHGGYLDQLLTQLQPFEEARLYLENFLLGIEIGIELKEKQIFEHEAKIKACHNQSGGNHEQEIRHHEEMIALYTQKLQEWEIEHKAVVARLLEAEGREWRSI